MTPPPTAAGAAPPFRALLATELRAAIRHPFTAYVAATTAAVVILFARAPRPWVIPQLFAEDGLWTSLLHTRGFWYAAFHGRPESDYCILGNILLLEAGRWWCALVHGGDPLELPRSCAWVSYLFYGAVFSLPVLLLRRRLPAAHLAALWLLACFMPLGIHDASYSGFEILGRISNIGFACLFAAFLLVWYRNTATVAPAALVAVDAGLLLCVTTNPLAAVVLPAAAWPALRDVGRGTRSVAAVARDPAVISLFVLAAAGAGLCGLPNPWKIRPREPIPPLEVATVVELGVARNTLYPLLWPVYRHLSTGATLGALAVVAAAIHRWGLPRHRALYLGGAALLMATAAVLVVFRPELGIHIGGYRGTFPDRYFYGQHLVGLTLMAAFAADVGARLRERGWLRHLPIGALVALLVAAVVHEPPWHLAPSQCLRPEGRLFPLRAARAVEEQRFVDDRLQADPAGRFVSIPNPEGTPKRIVLPRAPLERALRARGLDPARQGEGAVLPAQALEPLAR